jgi:hypothetical protein
MKNKKGMSDIVVTLIIIVLSLVAVGVVWQVVNGLIKSGTSSAELNAKCLGVNLEVTKANCSSGTTNKRCDVQVMRTGSTADALTGTKLVFRNETSGISSTSALDKQGDIPVAVGQRVHVADTLVANANGISKVEVTPYFTDGSGNIQMCSQTASFNFVG